MRRLLTLVRRLLFGPAPGPAPVVARGLVGPPVFDDLPPRCGICRNLRAVWPEQVWLYRDSPNEVCLPGCAVPQLAVVGERIGGGR